MTRNAQTVNALFVQNSSSQIGVDDKKQQNSTKVDKQLNYIAGLPS